MPSGSAAGESAKQAVWHPHSGLSVLPVGLFILAPGVRCAAVAGKSTPQKAANIDPPEWPSAWLAKR
jgi:hypothetical protein